MYRIGPVSLQQVAELADPLGHPVPDVHAAAVGGRLLAAERIAHAIPVPSQVRVELIPVEAFGLGPDPEEEEDRAGLVVPLAINSPQEGAEGGDPRPRRHQDQVRGRVVGEQEADPVRSGDVDLVTGLQVAQVV
jgi:hypothetical protein